MGVTNAFEKANAHIAAELGFRLDPAADNLEFRKLLYLIGWARFAHCVALTKLWAKPTARGPQKYARLRDLMKWAIPQKPDAVKYRSPDAEKARQMHAEMDAQLAAKIAAEP